MSARCKTFDFYKGGHAAAVSFLRAATPELMHTNLYCFEAAQQSSSRQFRYAYVVRTGSKFGTESFDPIYI